MRGDIWIKKMYLPKDMKEYSLSESLPWEYYFSYKKENKKAKLPAINELILILPHFFNWSNVLAMYCIFIFQDAFHMKLCSLVVHNVYLN